MYHAYAPEPIVLDTSLKGTCVGSGASCECGMVAFIAVGFSLAQWIASVPSPQQGATRTPTDGSHSKFFDFF